MYLCIASKKPYMESLYHTIKHETDQGNVEQARRLIDTALRETPGDTRLHYLKGCTYMKTGHWHEAMNCFMRGRTPDGSGPAAEMLDMLNGIMDFHDKELYNP